MSQNDCGCSSENETRSQCGTFAEPSNRDAGQCSPYRLRMDCEAPALPVITCDDDEYTTDYDPDNVESPFKIFCRLFDQACDLITDQDDDPITTYLT